MYSMHSNEAGTANWDICDDFKLKNTLDLWIYIKTYQHFNPFKPEFTMVIFIHYKPRIAVAILDLWWMKMIWYGLEIQGKITTYW